MPNFHFVDEVYTKLIEQKLAISSILTLQRFLQLRNRTVLTEKIINTGSSPEPLIKLLLHLVGHKGCPTKRTRFLIMVHPRVQARPVKNVLAVPQPPDLFSAFKLVQTNRTILGRVSVDHLQVLELDHWQDFSDQASGYRRVFGYSGRRVVGPNDVCFKKIG